MFNLSIGNFMKKNRKKLLAVVVFAASLFVLTWASGYSLAVNNSPSMPRGVYLLSPLKTPVRGDIVSVCIPNAEAATLYRERHYIPASTRCKSGIAPVLKPIVGLPGDTVVVDQNRVLINNNAVDQSAVFDTDSQGRPISHLAVGWNKTLAVSEYFLLANFIPRSLDSRYYGTVTRADMIDRAVPLITFN